MPSTDPVKIKANKKRMRRRLKLRVLRAYSGGNPSCACCGEAHFEFLCIDHVNGGGTRHRKVIGKGDLFYRALLQTNFPEGYRVLCNNCNMALGFYGYCPHQMDPDHDDQRLLRELAYNLDHPEIVEELDDDDATTEELNDVVVELRMDAVEDHIETVEGQVNEIARLMPEIRERFSAQPLSPAHQAAIQRGVTRLNELTGAPHAAIYNELRQRFKVGKYNQIPDARWPDVVAWFKPRIEDAERRAGHTHHGDPLADDERPAQGSLF